MHIRACFTIDLRVMIPPESVYQGIQNGDDEDKCKHLNIDKYSVRAQQGKINPVDSISSLIEEIRDTVEELLLPAHALVVEVQLACVVHSGGHGCYGQVDAGLGKNGL